MLVTYHCRHSAVFDMTAVRQSDKLFESTKGMGERHTPVSSPEIVCRQWLVNNHFKPNPGTQFWIKP